MYRLRRHLWLGWPLARWLGLLFVVALSAALILWQPVRWPAAVLGALFLGYVLVLAWTGRRGYVRFVTMPDTHNLLQGAPASPHLRAEELVPMRASGWFCVQGREQYYVDVEADFETVGSREHIVLGRIRPSRFLVVGQWPGHELGWWYIFFQPAMVRGLHLGHLHYGARPRLALRVIYTPDGELRQTVYFAFDDGLALRRVWEDLHWDAPPGVTT
jgi:hypothetical protein